MGRCYVAPVDSPDLTPPQGIYGLGAAPLEAGEVWIQDTELVYLSAQVGLGKGWDVAAALVPIPRQMLGGMELGYSFQVDESIAVRGTAGGFGTFFVLGDGLQIGGGGLLGVGASWGTRERHLYAGLKLALSPEDPATVFLPGIDGVWTFGRHFALLGGVGSVLAPSDAGHLYSIFLAGPAARFLFGRFSLDVGAQAVFGPGVGLGYSDGPRGVGVLPAPSLSLRYGFGG